MDQRNKNLTKLEELEMKYQEELERLEREEKEKQMKDKIQLSYPPNTVQLPEKIMEKSTEAFMEKAKSSFNVKEYIVKKSVTFLVETLLSVTFWGVLFISIGVLKYPEITMEKWGLIIATFSGLVLKRSFSEKSKLTAENKLEIEKVKVTPLNDEITNQIKSLLPVGQG